MKQKVIHAIASLLQMAALIASIVAVVSIIQAQKQISIQSEANELQRHSNEATDSTLRLLTLETSLRRQELDESTRARENDIKKYINEFRPRILIIPSCEFSDNIQKIKLMVTNTGKSDANNAKLSFECRDSATNLTVIRSDRSFGTIISNGSWTQPLTVQGGRTTIVKAVLSWSWNELGDELTNYLVLRSDTVRVTCASETLVGEDVIHYWR